MASSAPNPMPLSTRLSLIVGLLFGGGVAALGGWEFAAATDRVEETSRAKAEAAGADLRDEIDASYLETLASILPARDSVWTWDGQGTELHELHLTVTDWAARHGIERVRTLRPKDDHREALRRSGHARHRDAMEALVSSGAGVTWRKPVDYEPEMREPWLQARPSSRLRESVKLGTFIDTWLPLTDAHGHALMLLELTENVSTELATARTRAGFVALAGLILATSTVGLVAGAARRAEASVATVRATLARFASGNFGTAVRVREDPLLHEAEAARLEMDGRQRALAAKLGQAESRVRALEALLNRRTEVRRGAIARAASGTALVVDAGGCRREQAELVDLSHAHLVLRVHTYTAIDLAPGMSVNVAWIHGDEAGTELTVSRRMETTEGVEYVFALERELAGTPPEIACLAYTRAAERVNTELTPVSGTLLAGLGGPLSAQVIDLSADGAGLRLRVRPSALSATGTGATLLLRLGAGEAELAFGVIFRLLRAEGEGCFVGLQFDPEMTADFAARRATVAAWVTERVRELATGMERAA